MPPGIKEQTGLYAFEEGSAINGNKAHKTVLLAAVLLAPFFLSACKATAPPLRIPWQGGEISVMEVSRQGELLFYDESRIVEEGGALLFTSEYQYTSAPLTRRIYLDPETLLPRRSETLFTTAEGVKSSLDVLYGEGEARVKLSRGGKVEEKIVPLPERPCFDNEQLDLLLRTLPLEAGWKGRISLFVPATSRIAVINIEVIGREEVAVAADAYDCYIVELKGLGRRAWIGVEQPCPLVMSVNESDGTLSQLVEYHPGGDGEESEE